MGSTAKVKSKSKIPLISPSQEKISESSTFTKNNISADPPKLTKELTRISLPDKNKMPLSDRKQPNSARSATSNISMKTRTTDKKLREIEMKFTTKKNRYMTVRQEISSKEKLLESLKRELLDMRQQALANCGDFPHGAELLTVDDQPQNITMTVTKLKDLWDDAAANVVATCKQEYNSNSLKLKVTNKINETIQLTGSIVEEVLWKFSDIAREHERKIEEVRQLLKVANSKNETLTLRLRASLDGMSRKVKDAMSVPASPTCESKMKDLELRLIDKDNEIEDLKKKNQEMTHLLEHRRYQSLPDDSGSMGDVDSTSWTNWECKLLNDLDATRSKLAEQDSLIKSLTVEKDDLQVKLTVSQEIEKENKKLKEELNQLKSLIGEKKKESLTVLHDYELYKHVQYLRDQVEEIESMASRTLQIQKTMRAKSCQVESENMERKAEMSRLVIGIMKDRQSDVSRINRIVSKLEKYCVEAQRDRKRLEMKLLEMQ